MVHFYLLERILTIGQRHNWSFVGQSLQDDWIRLQAEEIILDVVENIERMQARVGPARRPLIHYQPLDQIVPQLLCVGPDLSGRLLPQLQVLGEILQTDHSRI